MLPKAYSVSEKWKAPWKHQRPLIKLYPTLFWFEKVHTVTYKVVLLLLQTQSCSIAQPVGLWRFPHLGSSPEQCQCALFLNHSFSNVVSHMLLMHTHVKTCTMSCGYKCVLVKGSKMQRRMAISKNLFFGILLYCAENLCLLCLTGVTETKV